MLRRVMMGLLAVLLAGMAGEVKADITIYAQDTALNSDGYGYLNIYATGLSTDTFDNYQVALSITPTGGSGGKVIFAPNAGTYPDPNAGTDGKQPYSYLYPPGWSAGNPTTASNYIFLNDSSDSNPLLTIPGGGYTNTSFKNPQYFTITDSSWSGAEYAPMTDTAPTAGTVSGTTLLASLLIHAVATSPMETYSVNLLFDTSSPPDDGTTYFSNSGTSLTDVDQLLGSTSGFMGNITINPASAVPEPSTIISMMAAVLTIGGFASVRRLGRSRRQAS